MKANPYMIFLSGALLLATVILFQNCSKVAVSDIPEEVTVQGDPTDLSPTPPPILVTPTTLPPPPPVTTLENKCDEAKATGRLTDTKVKLTFDNNNKTCSWGQNGNLSKLDRYVRARTETYQTVTIPADATICNVTLTHEDQVDFIYDDNIIMTLNNLILASTTTFSSHFNKVSGLYKYEWTRLVGKDGQVDASDSALDQQYCAGKSEGLASCAFPKTQTRGKIQLDFDERLIQRVLGLTSSKEIKLGVITTGDDNDTDCLHTPIQLNVEVQYFR